MHRKDFSEQYRLISSFAHFFPCPFILMVGFGYYGMSSFSFSKTWAWMTVPWSPVQLVSLCMHMESDP